MAAEYVCKTCDRSFQSLEGLTLIRDWSHGTAVYRDSAGLIHILRRKKLPKPPEPAPVVAPSAPQEVFVNILAEVMTETETRPELPAESEPLAEPPAEPWKQQLRRFMEEA